MGMPTCFAVHTNNRKGDDSVSKLDTAFIRAMADGNRTLVGEVSAFYFVVTKPYDNTRDLRIK
ncbi:MAG: hypothetical protein E6731_18620 [Lachnospiraceae bacterium]|nr:hypothetical protein [Lachnospiraceae bacterium]